MTGPRTCTTRGIASDEGRPWITAQIHQGIAHLDTHGLPRPISRPELRHLIGLLEALDRLLDAREPGAVVAREGL